MAVFERKAAARARSTQSRAEPLPAGDAKSREWDARAAIILTAIVLCFHLARMLQADGLWRDEAATAHLAANFSLKYVISNSQYELFPLLGPATVHIYGWVAGNSDGALRVFGMLVGLSIIGVLWWNMRTLCKGTPLVSLALLGFNGAFIQWGDAVRGYGLGIMFLLLTVGLIWRYVERPRPWAMALAALSGIASVQCLFNNAVLLLAICLAAAVVLVRREESYRAILVLLIGVPAALSLLPYLAPLHQVRDWDMLVRSPVSLESLCLKADQALSASGWWNTFIWLVLLALGLVVSFVGQIRSNFLHLGRQHRDLVLFSAVTILLGVGGYFGFLKTVSYPTQPWYYLATMALAAMSLDFVFDVLRKQGHGRMTMVGLLIVAAAALLPTWGQARVRQTNVDLVAAKLNQVAGKDDFIVVSPWYDGITFDRYYRGIAPWATVPPIQFHKFHRYDLVKEKMIMADQDEGIKPVLDKIGETLVSGHRVWVAGNLISPPPGEAAPRMQPAPDEQWGWQDEAYTIAWTIKITSYLEACARQSEMVLVETNRPVNKLENLPLKMFEGWGGR